MTITVSAAPLVLKSFHYTDSSGYDVKTYKKEKVESLVKDTFPNLKGWQYRDVSVKILRNLRPGQHHKVQIGDKEWFNIECFELRTDEKKLAEDTKGWKL